MLYLGGEVEKTRMTDPENTSAPQSQKPQWLQNLEAESWQAEMIVSGIAIFGSLQLPDLIEQLIDYELYELPETLAWPAYLMNIYLYIGVILLIVGFIIHFILRSLWIGMVGFNSVFPQGIQRNTEVLSEAFLDRLIEDYGDVNAYIKRLDNICSSLFAFAFSGAYTMLAICISILVLLLLSYGIHYLLPEYTILQILAVLGGVFFAVALLNSVFAIKALRESVFARRWQYPIAMTFNRLIYNFAARPVLTIQYTSLTGSNAKKYLGGVFGIMALIMLCLIPVIKDSRGIYLIDKVYWRYGSDPSIMRSSAYANTLTQNSLLLAPLLENSEISDNRSVWIFVPLPERELSILEAACDLPEIEKEELNDAEYRRLIGARFLQCADQYLDFSLNGQPLEAASWQRFYYPNHGEYGVKIYFNNLPAVPGNNLLSVTHGYRNEAGEPRVTYLPFQFLAPVQDGSIPSTPEQ